MLPQFLLLIIVPFLLILKAHEKHCIIKNDNGNVVVWLKKNDTEKYIVSYDFRNQFTFSKIPTLKFQESFLWAWQGQLQFTYNTYKNRFDFENIVSLINAIEIDDLRNYFDTLQGNKRHQQDPDEMSKTKMNFEKAFPDSQFSRPVSEYSLFEKLQYYFLYYIVGRTWEKIYKINVEYQNSFTIPHKNIFTRKDYDNTFLPDLKKNYFWAWNNRILISHHVHPNNTTSYIVPFDGKRQVLSENQRYWLTEPEQNKVIDYEPILTTEKRFKDEYNKTTWFKKAQLDQSYLE